MKSFTYERARSPAEAAAAAAGTRGAKFIAGGTNLLDLMKLEIETPTHLIDVNGLALDKIETHAGRRLAHRRARAQHRSRRARARAPRLRRAVARAASPAPRASCATWRRPRATCSSARAVRISTTPTCRATNACPAAAAARSAASRATTRSSARATRASRRIRATWPSRCACSTRRWRRSEPNGTDAPDPDRRLPPAARQHAAHRDRARGRRADHRGDAAEADRRHADLPQGARPRVVCVRAGVGRRDRAARRHRPRGAGRRRAQAVARRSGRARDARRRESRRVAACSPARAPHTTTHSRCRWSSARSPRCWPKRKVKR